MSYKKVKMCKTNKSNSTRVAFVLIQNIVRLPFHPGTVLNVKTVFKTRYITHIVLNVMINSLLFSNLIISKPNKKCRCSFSLQPLQPQPKRTANTFTSIINRSLRAESDLFTSSLTVSCEVQQRERKYYK